MIAAKSAAVKPKHLTLICALLFELLANSQLLQNFRFDHLTLERGFPAEIVQALEQDAQSNFWALTEKGLMCYNGHSGKFYPATGDSTGLLEFRPWDLYIDRTGLIWISYTDTVISTFDPVTEKFEHYIPDRNKEGSYPPAMAESIYEDSKNRLWIPTWGAGLSLFNRETKTFKTYRHDPADSTTVSTDLVNCVEEDADGTLLVGSWEGITDNYFQVFDPETEKFSRFDLSQYDYPATNGHFNVDYHLRVIELIRRDANNNLWIGTYNGAYFIDRTNMIIHKFFPGIQYKSDYPGDIFHDNITGCVFAPDGKVWFSTQVAGLLVIDTRTMTYEVVKKVTGSGTSISNDIIKDLFIDHNGKIFVSTQSGGIDVYDPIQNQFHLVTNRELSADRFATQKSHAILSLNHLSADSLILVGSGSGLSIYHKTKGLIKKIVPTDHITDVMIKNPIFHDGYKFCPPNFIHGIWVFPDRWLIASIIGPLRYYPDKDLLDFSLVGYYHKPSFAQQESDGGYFQAAVFRDERMENGNRPTELWICRYDYHQDKVFKIGRADINACTRNEPPSFILQDFARIDSIYYFIETSPTCFQIFNCVDSTFTAYGCYPPLQNFPDSLMRPLASAGNGEIWLTSDNGFYRFNARTGHTENFREKLNLKKTDKIQSAVVDKNGILWIGLRQDLIRFDPETNELYRFSKIHGLDVGNHVQRHRDRAWGDTVYVPVAAGLLYFEPEKVRIDSGAFNTLLTYVIINRDTLSISETEEFLSKSPTLSWDQNFITFEYYSTQIYSAGSKTYHYRLLGMDSTWQSNSVQNIAQYTNLNPGEYTFEVYCENIYGVKSAVLRIPFSISKPFWLMWWFILMEVILGCFIVYMLIKYRERKMRAVQEKLEKTVKERTSEIELQKEIIEDKNKELTDSIRYAKRIQNTLLAHAELLKENLPEHFVLFKPKDIVSGDFYWASKHNNHFYVAVCDSTGHGVPGAFMSLLNIRFLNEAIVERNISQPNEILNFVRERLINNLSSEGAKDGMDGTVFYMDTVAKQLHYASAHNTPVLIRDGSAQELSADKMPIGAGERLQPFALRTVDLQPGDVVYFFTDGYADQFGGPKGKKLKQKNLIEQVVQLHRLPMNDQHAKLDHFITDWKGDLEQIDDILIIGIKIEW